MDISKPEYENPLAKWMLESSLEEKEQTWKEIMQGVTRDQQKISDQADAIRRNRLCRQ